MATEPLPSARLHNQGSAARIPTLLLVRDELVGFAKSKVMLVLWLLMPALALVAYLLLPETLKQGPSGPLSATGFITLIESSLAGTMAGLMAAVDLVSEKNRNVYVLLVIRPIRRDTIVWAKFIGVALCVIAACVLSIMLGFVVDAFQGEPLTGAKVYDALKSLLSMSNAIAISAAAGVLIGVGSRTILVAVLLVLYGGQNLAFVPMVPVYFGLMDRAFWWLMAISVVLIAGVMWLAAWAFRRAQL